MPSLPRLLLHLLFAFSLALAAIGAAMVARGRIGGWPAFAFFGMTAAVLADQLWPSLLRPGAVAVEDLLRRFPQTVELKAGRLRLGLSLVACAVFFGVCHSLLQRGDAGWLITLALWLGAILFGLAVPLFVVLILRGASLRLAADGFVVRHGWRSHAVPWQAAGRFSVQPVPRGLGALVVYDDARLDSRAAGDAAGPVGRRAALPDSYGLEPEDLARLLNGWRELALASAS
ncbi:hypothetical protein BN1110_02081 [bacterium YEK0313]|nr:hypothetical protein BN1110_02081 [bacterium YEK0313]